MNYKQEKKEETEQKASNIIQKQKEKNLEKKKVTMNDPKSV